MNDMSEHAAATERRTTTVEEARQMHPAVGRGRLYAALREGQIRSAKVGKRFAIDVADLDRWVMAGSPINHKEITAAGKCES
jgi:excisionase family DNA binding protein